MWVYSHVRTDILPKSMDDLCFQAGVGVNNKMCTPGRSIWPKYKVRIGKDKTENGKDSFLAFFFFFLINRDAA